MAGLMCLIQLAIGTLNILLVMLFVAGNTDFCGSVFETQVDYALIGHDLGKTVVTDEFECQLKCIGKNSCKSFNVHFARSNEANTICELNNNTRETKPGDFKGKKGSTYYGSVEVSCIDAYNLPNTPYNADHCHPGYKGERCQMAKRGWYAQHPGHSCMDILDSGDSKGDGEYWIDPEKTRNPLKAYCDMTTDGRGWLLIFNIVIDGPSPAAILGIETSYRGIGNYNNNNNNNNMVFSTSALNELRTHLSFTQLRFHCNKQTTRTFHVTTVANSTGEAVVQYFSRQTDAMPDACGSFARLDGDNSHLAKECARWGRNNNFVYEVGLWGHEGMRELYKFPAFIAYSFHWATYPDWNRWECDDTANSALPGDFWKIYVR